VKEKQDGQSPLTRDCPPPILQSSTETAAPSHDQPEISSSSLGNSIGGKKGRVKRQTHEDGVVDVVFDDGDGHESNAPNETLEKRILVNISIALDSGLGSTYQEVYQLQVAVPLPKEKLKSQTFYAYDVEANSEIVTMEKLVMVSNETTTETFSDGSIADTSTDDSTSSTDESSTTSYDDFFASSSTEGLSKSNLNESRNATNGS
jgi:hypothetical protein